MTAAGRPGRFQRAAPTACFVLAGVSGLTALGALLGLTARSNDLHLGFDAYALILAAPFGLLAGVSTVAGRYGLRLRLHSKDRAALSRARVLLGVGLVPLFVGLVSSIGLGFLSIDGTGPIAATMTTLARLGVPLTLLFWIVAMVMNGIARVSAS